MIDKKDSKRFLIGVIFFWFSQYVYVPHQVNYLSNSGVSTKLIGLTLAFYGLSQMLLRIPVGFISDYFKITKPIILLGTIVVGLASVIRLIYTNGDGFLIANLFSGIGSALWISFIVYYIENSEDKNCSSGEIISAMNVGLLVAFITSCILYPFISMKGIVSLSIVSSFLAFIFIYLSLSKVSDGYQKKATIKKFRSRCNLKPFEILKVVFDKKVIFFGILALIQQGIQAATALSFSNKIIENIGGSKFDVGISSVIFMISSVFFSTLTKKDILLRIGKYRSMLIAFTSLCVYLLGFSVVNNIYMAMILQILPGIATGLFLSYATLLSTLHIEESKKSTAMGSFQAIFAIGLTIFPLIISKLTYNFGIQRSYLILIIAPICAIIMLILNKETINKTIL